MLKSKISSTTPAPPPVSDPTDDLIYRISHDLGAGMRSLVLLSSWIAEDVESAGFTLPSEVQANVDMLKVRGARLQALIKDLLTYARVGQGGGAFGGDWAAMLDPILQDVAGIEKFTVMRRLRAIPQIGHDDLALLFTVLVVNAVRHHDAGAGHIEIASARVGQSIVLSVTDDGPGIPVQQRIHLCKPLTHLKLRDHSDGSGMGLAIAGRIAAFYGGTLCISDAPQARGCQVVAAFPWLTAEAGSTRA